MNQVKTEPGSPVYQETGHSQSTVEFFLGPPIFVGTQDLLSMCMPSMPPPPPQCSGGGYGGPMNMAQNYMIPPPGNSGGSTSSSLPQEGAGASARSSLNPPDTLPKRELNLMKNREAARECRRKKKEYYKCLENHVAMLENQKKNLIEELRALKDIDRHKAE